MLPDLPTVVVWLGPAVAAAAVAWRVDRRFAAPLRGESPPPGFASPRRRALAFGLVAATLYAGLFLPLVLPGLTEPIELSAINPARLFLVHALLAAVLAAWVLVAYGGGGRSGEPPVVAPDRRPA